MTCTGARDIPQSRTYQKKAHKLRELKWDHATYVLFYLRSSAGKVISRGEFVSSGDVFALCTVARPRQRGLREASLDVTRILQNAVKRFLLSVCKEVADLLHYLLLT